MKVLKAIILPKL